MKITGKNYIGEQLAGAGEVTFRTFNPATNAENEPLFTEASSSEIDQAVELAWEAFEQYRTFFFKIIFKSFLRKTYTT